MYKPYIIPQNLISLLLLYFLNENFTAIISIELLHITFHHSVIIFIYQIFLSDRNIQD